MSVGQVGVFGLCSQDPRVNGSVSKDIAFYRSSSDAALAYPPPQDQILTRRAWLLDPLGHPSDLYYSDIAADELKSLLTEFKPEIAVLEGLWTHRYIELLKAHQCRVILDCHDAHYPQSRQLADLTDGDDLRARVIRKILPERVKLIEHKATHAVDQLWVCSSKEARLMEGLYRPPAPIHVVPNGVDHSYYNEAGAGKHRQPRPLAVTGRTFVFPAMFAYQPNRVAAAFLIEEIFPRLANVFPDCRLVLAGSWPTAQMMDAAKREPRIVVTGSVPDIRPYLAAASAMVVPLFQGSGTRLKILEAWAARVPVVSTAKGAEGLDAENEKHLLIAESAQEFVESLRRLWMNRSLAEKLIENGLELVKREYSREATSRRIRLAVNDLQASAPVPSRE